MENQEMQMPAAMPSTMPPQGMPQEMSAPGPDQMAIYEQMRQQISPQEFSNEMLAGASQIDPQAVAEFMEEIQSADISAEELDELNNVVDEILANPEQYGQIRQRYISQGLEEDLLPEQFDPGFFAALNMAVDQLIAAPTGVQSFAKGGIAELKPIAKAIASYGRNGDTMLAHITPAEARMLRRRGGSGTINPDTGLPEFFKKAFRKIGKAVKKFASSSVGKLITTVALGFFLGPAAASFLGATSAAGVAAVTGFVGSAGATALGGGNLKDSLKAGITGAVTAGVTAGITGGADAFKAGSYTGPTTVGGQVDKFKSAIGLGPGAQAPLAPVVDAPAAVPGTGTGAPVPPDAATGVLDATAAPGSLAKVPPPPPPSGSLLDTAKDFYTRNTPTAIREAGTQNAMSMVQKQFPGATAEQIMSAPASSVLGKAFQAATPGILSTYGPTVAAGLGVIGAAGGFKTKEPELSASARELLDRDKDRVKIEDRPDLFYIQGLPGVKYDDKGKIIGSTPYEPTPTSLDDIRVPAPGMSTRPPMYTPEAGSMGAGQGVSQQYNTSSMYGNVMRPTPMPQVRFPGMNSSMPGGGMGPITTMPFAPGNFASYGGGLGGGMQGYAEGGEVEDPDYMMQGGIAHLSMGGFLRRAGRVVQQGLRPITEIRDQREQRQIAAQQYAAQQATAAQQAAAAEQAAEQERQRVLSDRQARAAQFAQGMQFNSGMQPGFNAPSGGIGIPSMPNTYKPFADGGIAGLAKGGYPRRTGQISGPGTEKSDSIPAMLSDGEFVMTAAAVRGAGKGSRRAGAKQMYKLMHQLEKNSQRG